MQKEIELKFKINRLPIECNNYVLIHQYYFDYLKYKVFLLQAFNNLQFESIKEARIRTKKCVSDVKFVLTLKSGDTNNRDEYEKEVSVKDVKTLIKNNILGLIKKKRYEVVKGNFTFEFDEYIDKNKPLIITEVESKEQFTTKQLMEIQSILRDTFKLKYEDVTNDKDYKNKNLAKNGGYENGNQN